LSKRRCGICPGNVRFAARARLREIMFRIQTDTPEENGTLIFRLSGLTITAVSARQMFVQVALDLAR